jgi:hypothetical protein
MGHMFRVARGDGLLGSVFSDLIMSTKIDDDQEEEQGREDATLSIINLTRISTVCNQTP